MDNKVDSIVVNADSLGGSIDWKLLAEYTDKVQFPSVTQSSWENITHLHILGSVRSMDNENTVMPECYFNSARTWALILGSTQKQIRNVLLACGNKLQLLDIRFTDIQTVDVTHLTGIRKLLLCDNSMLHLVDGINQLPALEVLNLYNTFVGPKLDLTGNAALKELTIVHTRISTITLERSLVQMKILRAMGCELDNLDFVKYLPSLNTLFLDNCPVADLSPLEELKELEVLDISHTRARQLPRLEEMRKLKVIDLSETPIDSLDGVIFPKTIERLSLVSLKLQRLPNSIRELKNLKRLDLSWIDLKETPQWLPELKLECRIVDSGSGIILRQARIAGVAMNTLDSFQGLIRAWFQEQKEKIQEDDELNEVKVIFLGDGEAGKTYTIARLLKDGKMLLPSEIPEDATPGIVITDKTYRIGDRDVQVHFWDFGGQEILHSMHRMFLTERTLYVVLLNARDNTQDERARYWLHNIRSFAGNAPVLLVLNKTDQNEYATVNISDLRRLSPGLPEAVRLSALRDSPEDFNRKLTGAMLDAISRIDTINTFFPNSWKQVKNALQTMETPYIRGDAYKRLCDQHRVDGSIQKSVLDLFKTLGVSFYYPGAKLEDYVVLRPDWITNAIYIILFNKRKEVKNGLISHETIYRLLNPRAGDTVKRVLPDAVYRPEEINYVLDVVRRFRLSYLVEDGMEFIPMLCAGNSLPVAEEYEKALDTLEFRMVYDYLPNNVIHRLMVELRQHLDQTNVWLTGARFREGSKGFSAVVKTEGNLLRIFVRAEKDRYTADMYLDTIRDALERINDTMGLKVAENQVVYKADGIVECFNYDMLVGSQKAGIPVAYSMQRNCAIKIEDILSQTDHQVDADRAALIGHLLSACRKLQGSSMYWDAREDDRNTYIRDLLRTQGYLVFDQTLCGASASGKQAGELDLEIRREQDMPWTIFEALNLSGKGKTQMDYWDGHLQKLLDNYNAHGLPFLFHVSYVACGKDQFSGVCGAYADHLRFHSPEPYSLQFTGPLRTMPEGYGENHFLQAYQCVYDCNGFPTTVYHIFVRLGA